VRSAMRVIDVGRGGVIVAERVVAVGRADSAPMRRLVRAVAPDRMINLTFGRPRRAVVVLDSGHVALVALSPETVAKRLAGENRCGDDSGEN
jgi:regulator of extracellular matrix RemA (YlzA/DUF370 family)